MSASEAEQDLSSGERAGLEFIRESGGAHQSDFWKELNISSRKGSHITEVLELLGLIKRTETVYNGYTTYYLEPAACGFDFSMSMAGDMFSPFIGEEEISANSNAFSQWLMNLTYEEY